MCTVEISAHMWSVSYCFFYIQMVYSINKQTHLKKVETAGEKCGMRISNFTVCFTTPNKSKSNQTPHEGKCLLEDAQHGDGTKDLLF